MAAPETGCWDIVGVGASSVDYVTVVPLAPEATGVRAKQPLLARETTCGGQTATALATCARFGLRACYVGAVGSDDNGRRIREALAGAGVDAHGAIVRSAAHPYAVIVVDRETGGRLVFWSRDDGLRLAPCEIDAALVRSARLVHVDDVDEPAALHAAEIARAAGLPVTSDVERASPEAMAIIEAVTHAIVAEHVPAALTGASGPDDGLRRLARRTGGVLCVTLGSRGALLLEEGRLYHEPAFRVSPVDTTGAGDVFRGAFAYGLLQAWPAPRILRFACAAAAVSCLRLGAMAGVPSLEDVLALAAAQGRPI